MSWPKLTLLNKTHMPLTKHMAPCLMSLNRGWAFISPLLAEVDIAHMLQTIICVRIICAQSLKNQYTQRQSLLQFHFWDKSTPQMGDPEGYLPLSTVQRLDQ